jgi:hypothetical protein
MYQWGVRESLWREIAQFSTRLADFLQFSLLRMWLNVTLPGGYIPAAHIPQTPDAGFINRSTAS